MKDTQKLFALTVSGLCAMAINQSDAFAKKAGTAKGTKSPINCQQKNGCAGKGGCAGYTTSAGAKESANGCAGKNACHNHVVVNIDAAKCAELKGSELKVEDKSSETKKDVAI